MAAQIPESHRDLLGGPILVTLTTLGPDGAPENSVVLVFAGWRYRPRQHLRRPPQTRECTARPARSPARPRPPKTGAAGSTCAAKS